MSTNDKIDALIDSIKAIKKNRLFFSVEDIEMLDDCISQLENLKKDINDAVSFSELKTRLLSIIIVLDRFFGLGDYIRQYFDLP